MSEQFIIVSPVIEDKEGVQKIIGWDVHVDDKGLASKCRFKTKKRAFIYAHEQSASTLRRVQEIGIHKPKLDTEKM